MHDENDIGRRDSYKGDARGKHGRQEEKDRRNGENNVG